MITAKNFLLAFRYAEYMGKQDHRWAIYVTGRSRVRSPRTLRSLT